MRLVVVEVDEFTMQRPEPIEIGWAGGIPTPRPLQARVECGSKHGVVDSHIQASADQGHPFRTLRKHRAVEDNRVAAVGKLRGRGRRGSSDGLVPSGALPSLRVRERIIEKAEEEIDRQVDTRGRCLG